MIFFLTHTGGPGPEKKNAIIHKKRLRNAHALKKHFHNFKKSIPAIRLHRQKKPR